MYEINTKDRSYRATRARDAAEVAHAWQRNGLNPSAYVITNDGLRLTIGQVALSRTVADSAKRLARRARLGDGPYCIKCEIEQDIGYCRCEIAANH